MHPSRLTPSAARPTPNLGILIADDEQVVRSVLREALSRAGFTVWLASDGAEAVEVHASHAPQIGLVLLDVLMPRLHGPAAFEAIRRADPGVVGCFMTGYAPGYSEEGLLASGARHVFAKPFDLGVVCQTLAGLGDPASRCAG